MNRKRAHVAPPPPPELANMTEFWATPRRLGRRVGRCLIATIGQLQKRA